MKKLLLLGLLIVSAMAFSQGKSISFAKKSVEPITINDKTIKVGDIVYFQLGGNPDGSFQHVQDLNGFNEPLKPSASRTAMVKQPIKFFKEKDGVVYAFTKFYVTNLAAAMISGEIQILPSDKK